jgi:hypothetical protein
MSLMRLSNHRSMLGRTLTIPRHRRDSLGFGGDETATIGCRISCLRSSNTGFKIACYAGEGNVNALIISVASVHAGSQVTG